MSNNDIKEVDSNIFQTTSVQVDNGENEEESNNQSKLSQNPAINTDGNKQEEKEPSENGNQDSSPNQKSEGKKLRIFFLKIITT